MLVTLKFKVLTHHSPNHSPCDYEVFLSFKKFSEGKCFSTNAEVKKNGEEMDVTSWVRILDTRNV